MSLDKTYGDTWQTRREKLGELSYEDFLKSPQWAALKQRARGRRHFSRCWICGSTKSIDLHHTSYKWIDKPELRNVRPICRTHHEEIHEFALENRISVRIATNKVFKEWRNRSRIDRLARGIP